MPTPARPPILRLVAVAFAAVVVAGVSPSRGVAACGDYVHILKPGDSLAPPGQPHEGKPGEGPNCSGKPGTLPPLTAPVVEASDTKEWAACVTGDPDNESGSRGLPPPRSEGSPVQLSRAIFHPPRA